MVVLIFTPTGIEDAHFLTSLLTVYVIRLLHFCLLFTDQLPYNFSLPLNLAFALAGVSAYGFICHS